MVASGVFILVSLLNFKICFDNLTSRPTTVLARNTFRKNPVTIVTFDRAAVKRRGSRTNYGRCRCALATLNCHSYSCSQQTALSTAETVETAFTRSLHSQPDCYFSPARTLPTRRDRKASLRSDSLPSVGAGRVFLDYAILTASHPLPAELNRTTTTTTTAS